MFFVVTEIVLGLSDIYYSAREVMMKNIDK